MIQKAIPISTLFMLEKNRKRLKKLLQCQRKKSKGG